LNLSANKVGSIKPGVSAMRAPGFFRRLAAITYDTLLLLAVLFFATLLVLPFNHGEAFNSGQYFFPCYLVLIAFLFFGWFWTHGGQTLGLRAWKMRVIPERSGSISWKLAGFRFLAAMLSWGLLGVGFWWILVDPKRQALHDRLSKTRVDWVEAEKAHLDN
jgi:uncharacterized RDD family membrane protein YckC